MIEFSNEFFEDEVIDGFYVPSVMKRSWACCLELLFALDQICVRHGLKYTLDWGSMIGAVRHGGIIPWDDDIDVVMHRNDLDRLREYAKTEMPDGFEFLDYKNTVGEMKFIVSLANTGRMNFDEEYLRTHHNFPYIASIDIFVMDNVTDDEEYEKRRKAQIKRILGVVELIEKGDISRAGLQTLLDNTSAKTGIDIDLGADDIETKRNLFTAALKIMTEKNDTQTGTVAQIVPWFVEYDITHEASVYQKLVRVPFMGMEAYLPVSYERLLTSKFGNYAKVIYGTGVHEYPYFEAQRKSLGENIDYIPRYTMPKVPYVPDISNDGSIKSISVKYLDILGSLLDEYAKNNSGDVLARIQEITVEYGGLVERAYGETTRTVRSLEKLCEDLFLAYEGQISCQELNANREHIATEIESEIMLVREVVFIPYKYKYWRRMSDFYVKECEYAAAYDAENGTRTRIYVIAPKLYKKNHLMQLTEDVTDACSIDDIEFIDAKAYDFQLRHPQSVYFQSPYDEYNLAMSIDPSLYVSALRPYTDRMVYVPYFSIGNMTEMNQPLEFNMNYFVTMPGVAMSDEIVLEHGEERDRYLDKLLLVCGKETKEYWSSKLVVTDRSETFAAIAKARKEMLFYISPSPFSYDAKAYIGKLEQTMDVFEENATLDVKVLLSTDTIGAMIDDDDVVARWNTLLARMNSLDWCELVAHDANTDIKALTSSADAYYGLTSVCVKDMIYAKKPVMIMSINCC